MTNENNRARTLQLVSALAGVSVFGLSFGLLYPLMALHLESAGYSPSYIGIVAAMQPMGLVLSNFLLPAIAALLLAAFLFGSTILQMPLSFLLSKARVSAQLPINVAAIAVSFLAMVLLWDSYLIWPVTAVAGALTSSINTIALDQLGRKLVGSDLISGTASLTTVWGMNALVATPVAGVGMDLAGPQALPYSIVLFCALSLIVSLALSLRARPPAPA